MKRLPVAGLFALSSLALSVHAQAGELIKTYDAATGTDEPFTATAPWQVKWNSGSKTAGITVRIVDAATGAYVSEVDGVSGAVRVDASGTFKVSTTGAPSQFRITISKLP